MRVDEVQASPRQGAPGGGPMSAVGGQPVIPTVTVDQMREVDRIMVDELGSPAAGA